MSSRTHSVEIEYIFTAVVGMNLGGLCGNGFDRKNTTQVIIHSIAEVQGSAVGFCNDMFRTFGVGHDPVVALLSQPESHHDLET